MELFILRYLPTIALLIAIGVAFSFADYKPEPTSLDLTAKPDSVNFTKSTSFKNKYERKLSGSSGLVEGTFYRIDSTNITYSKNKTCLHSNSNNKVLPENNLDQIGSSDQRHSFLVVAVTNAYKYKRKCHNTATAPSEPKSETSNYDLEDDT